MKKTFAIFKKALPYIFAAIVFILLAVAYCNPLLSGKVLYQGDIKNYEGMSHEATEFAQKTGKSTGWTNSMFSGMPTYQISGYSVHNGFTKILDAIISFFKKLSTLFFNSIFGLFIGYFVGFFIMMRAFGINKWLSIAGAIAIALSSYFIFIIPAGHQTKAMALGALAPIIGGFYLIFRKNYLWGVPLTMLYSTIGIMYHPQMTYYVFMMLGVFGIAEIILHIKEKRVKDLCIGLLCFIFAMGVGVGTKYSQIKSNSDYAKETMRGGHSDLDSSSETSGSSSGLSFEYATQWSYGIDETLTLLVPNYMGGASGYNVGTNSKFYKDLRNHGVDPAQAKQMCEQLPTYWGDQPFTAGPVYVGAIICFLFVLGLFIVKGAYKWAILISVLFSILLSWGYHFSGLTSLFFNYFPYYNKFRTVSSILIVVEIAMPLLAFLAIKAIMDKEVTKEKAVRGIYISAGITGGIALILLLFGGALCSFTSPADGQILANAPAWLQTALLDQRKSMLQSDAFRSLAFVILGAATVLFFAKGKLQFKYFVATLGILILADMWPVDRRFFNDDNFVSKREDKAFFDIQPYEQHILEDKDPHFRVINLATNTFNDARTSYYLKSVGGYHAAKLRRYQDLIVEHMTGPDKFDMNVLNMLNTKYFIVPTKNGAIPQYNPDHFGNGWFVDRVISVNTANEESDMLKTLDLKTTAVTDVKFKEFIIPNSQPDSSASIKLDSYQPDVLEYTTNSNEEKTAVFSEIYYPYGWKAYIDGEPSEHFRVDYTLRELNIPAGEHKVRFEFRPDSVCKGYKVSAAFNLILILFILGSAVYGIRTALRKKEE